MPAVNNFLTKIFVRYLGFTLGHMVLRDYDTIPKEALNQNRVRVSQERKPPGLRVDMFVFIFGQEATMKIIILT